MVEGDPGDQPCFLDDSCRPSVRPLMLLCAPLKQALVLRQIAEDSTLSQQIVHGTCQPRIVGYSQEYVSISIAVHIGDVLVPSSFQMLPAKPKMVRPSHPTNDIRVRVITCVTKREYPFQRILQPILVTQSIDSQNVA